MTVRLRAVRIALAAALALCAEGSAQAQLRRTAPNAQPPALQAVTLKRRLGIDVAEALLKSTDADERQRGFERLSSVGTAQALDLLLKVFDPGGAARSARDRLVAVRALGPHAKVPAVRELLVRVMVGVGSNPERPEAIDGLIEHAAALALAASGDDAAISALAKAVRQPGHVAETAKDALLAFPPRNLQPLLQSRSSPTKTLVSVLRELGDPRAVPALRLIVQTAPAEVRADAAVALAHFGDNETLELARHWLRHETSPELRLASAKILLELQAPDAGAVLSQLLANAATRSAALTLADSVSLPALSSELKQLASKAQGEERAELIAALGRAGTREAAVFLGAALGARETSSAAALALALAPGKDAEAELERALGSGSTRRVAVRASAARIVALDRTPSGFESALAALGRSRDAADLATFVEIRAVTSPPRVAELLRRASPAELRALGRAALIPEVALALSDRLASEPNESLRTALAASLALPEAAERVPTDVLLGLLEARGLAAPLSARALAMRDSPTLRPKILNLLASDDALLRSHVALGLGRSEESSALGVLERAYRFETNDEVRLAIVQGLSARGEPARKRILGLARALDGSRAVREAAALALAGAEPAARPRGPASAWLDFSLLRSDNDTDRVLTAAALVIGPGGLAIPAYADPDGILLLPGLPTGKLTLRLAAPARTDDAPRPKPP